MHNTLSLKSFIEGTRFVCLLNGSQRCLYIKYLLKVNFKTSSSGLNNKSMHTDDGSTSFFSPHPRVSPNRVGDKCQRRWTQKKNRTVRRASACVRPVREKKGSRGGRSWRILVNTKGTRRRRSRAQYFGTVAGWERKSCESAAYTIQCWQVLRAARFFCWQFQPPRTICHRLCVSLWLDR